MPPESHPGAVRRYFGTDGVRGPYNGPVLTDAFASRLGLAAGRFFQNRAEGRRKVLLGRDTRASGPSLLAAVAGGLRVAGFEPVSLGILPTPAVARAVGQEGAALGVMITASHNPAADNGIKFFHGSGLKLSDSEEAAIEGLLPSENIAIEPVTPPETDGAAVYCAAVRRLLPDHSLVGWRIALDTANGATVSTSPSVLRSLGAEVMLLGGNPDGLNINADVGSEHPNALRERVRHDRCRLGVAHDGDGDRCVLCDERGELLDGDEILTVLALHAIRKGTLAHRTLVVTVQSNLGVDKAIEAAGGRVCRTPVGDRYVMERMRAEGAVLGGESSGHIIRADLSPAGDGLVAALGIMEVMREMSEPLSSLRRVLRRFPQATAALRVREKVPLANLTDLRQAIAAVEKEFGESGRVLVRYSGTEPKLRLLVEGPDKDAVTAGMNRLKTAARRSLQDL